ncbi:MAG: hypothetical protein J0M04_09220 [Verrucomicrobia bacterium]|nr:hypothetical protein [Verrucomicrobiota bacterium]
MATLLGLWFIIFGVTTALTPLHMEAGVDITQEKIKATLCAPILSWFGMAVFFAGHRQSPFLALASLLVTLGSPLLMLFRCRTSLGFWILTAVHTIVVTISGIGYSQVTRYWNEIP